MFNFVGMMIEKHISALLYRYQCVTVPGFGAFLTEICPAQLDAGTNTFYPPKKLISFNANVKNNDGLLANHIALQQKISYDTAVAEIQQAVSLWMERLRSGETIALTNLGDMSLNTEGNLSFNPDTPVNYLTDAFGLSSIISPAIKREVFKEIYSEELVEEEEAEETETITLVPKRRRGYAFVRYAAAVIILAGFGTAGAKVYHDNEVAKQTLIVEQNVQEKVQQHIQQATFFISSPMPAVSLHVKEEAPAILPYHVVAGAFRSEANAQKAVSELITQGFANAKALEKNKFGLYPVLYGSYGTYNEARDSMRSIHKTVNHEAWLLVKEL
jgi:nucleoid DNA-binding protein